MTEEKSHDEYIKELPKDILESSVQVIRAAFDIDTILRISEEYHADPEHWWAGYHHGWGTAIRNLLRDKVCRDNKLPSGNWDDVYIPIVEIALGLREVDK